MTYLCCIHTTYRLYLCKSNECGIAFCMISLLPNLTRPISRPGNENRKCMRARKRMRRMRMTAESERARHFNPIGDLHRPSGQHEETHPSPRHLLDGDPVHFEEGGLPVPPRARSPRIPRPVPQPPYTHGDHREVGTIR